MKRGIAIDAAIGSCQKIVSEVHNMWVLGHFAP